jgi:hypothetical protein
MAAFELHPHERDALLRAFARPFPAEYLGSQEDMPGWQLLEKKAGVAWIHSGSWAVARVTVEGGQAVDVEILTPEGSREAWRRWDFRIKPAERERILAGLVPGVPAEAALDALYSPRRYELRLCRTEAVDGGQKRWYRLHDSGLLVLSTDAAGLVVAVSLVEGEAAADRYVELVQT